MSLFIMLVVVGLVLIGLEVFLPGGVLGIAGFICLGAAVVVAFYKFEPIYGMVALIGALLVGCVYFYMLLSVLPNTRFWRSFNLETEIKGTSTGDAHDGIQIGLVGETLTDLLPSGIAKLDGRRVDVVTEVGFIPKGTPVEIQQIEGFRILVKPATEAGKRSTPLLRPDKPASLVKPAKAPSIPSNTSNTANTPKAEQNDGGLPPVPPPPPSIGLG